MKLTPKEFKILGLVALGYTDKEVSVKAKITYSTVRSHVDRLVLKLNARNRTHAAIIYMKNNPSWLNGDL